MSKKEKLRRDEADKHRQYLIQSGMIKQEDIDKEQEQEKPEKKSNAIKNKKKTKKVVNEAATE